MSGNAGQVRELQAAAEVATREVASTYSKLTECRAQLHAAVDLAAVGGADRVPQVLAHANLAEQLHARAVAAFTQTNRALSAAAAALELGERG